MLAGVISSETPHPLVSLPNIFLFSQVLLPHGFLHPQASLSQESLAHPQMWLPHSSIHPQVSQFATPPAVNTSCCHSAYTPRFHYFTVTCIHPQVSLCHSSLHPLVSIFHSSLHPWVSVLSLHQFSPLINGGGGGYLTAA